MSLVGLEYHTSAINEKQNKKQGILGKTKSEACKLRE